MELEAATARWYIRTPEKRYQDGSRCELMDADGRGKRQTKMAAAKSQVSLGVVNDCRPFFLFFLWSAAGRGLVLEVTNRKERGQVKEAELEAGGCRLHPLQPFVRSHQDAQT